MKKTMFVLFSLSALLFFAGCDGNQSTPKDESAGIGEKAVKIEEKTSSKTEETVSAETEEKAVPAADSPRTVVLKWGKALLDGDLEKANQYSTERGQKENDAVVNKLLKSDQGKAAFTDILAQAETGEETINGNDAKITLKKDGISLIKVDGVWKVNDI